MKMNRLQTCVFVAATVCLIAIAGSAPAITIYKLNYQGRLTDAGGATVADGPHTVTFRIYTAPSGGAELWNSGPQTVTTTNGLFSYELGSNVFFPADLFDGNTRHLGITVGTDPELTPRIQLTSSAYSMHAVKADVSGFADNADLLDGKNSTDFVDKTGDVMSGSLGFTNGTTPMTYIYQSGTANSPRPLIAHSPAFPDWGLMYDDLNDEFVFTGAGDTNLVVKPNGFGDNAVRLGADAISAPEILDEPGLTHQLNSSIITLNTATMSDLAVTSITIPSSGYVYLTGTTNINLGGTNNTNLAEVQIDETAGGSATAGYFTIVGMTNYLTAPSENHFAVTSHRVYFKSAGTYTFRLEGKLFASATGNATAGWGTLTAIYLPTSYGSVVSSLSTSNGDPNAKVVQIPDLTGNGNTTTAYQVDLRTLEIEARKAREAALRAELRLKDAQAAAHQQ